MINKILQFLIYQFTLVKKIVDSLLINIKQIRFLPNKIILFLSLALSACDSGCIDAASLGTEDAVSVSLGANPTVSIATIVSTDNSSSCNNTLKPSDNPTDFVAFGSGDACNINADVAYSYLSVYDSNDNDTYSDDNGTENDDYCYTFWKKLNIQYDSNFDYAIGISGSIEQCSSETTWPDSLDFILSASAIDGTNLSFVNYNVDDEVSKIDALDIGKNDYNDFNASITPTLSPYDCENDKVIFYSNMGTNYNNSKIYNVDYGNDASDIDYYSCSSADFLNATSGCGNPLALTNIKNEGDDLANEVSAIEVPRGCEVTVYEDESGSGFSTTLHVPVKFPDPYFYYLKDFRYDQEGDSARGRDDKISAFLIMQDDSEDVYQNCGDTNNYHGYNYFFKKELFGNRWDIRDDDDNLIRFYNPEEWRSGFNKLEGTFSQHNYFNTADQDKEFETENFKNDSGLEIQNRIGNDDLTSFALTQGCKITLYESSADDDSSEIIEQAYPSFQNFDDVESQIFYPEFFGVMSDATLGYLENIPQADYGVEQGFCYDADGCPGYDQNFTQCSSGDCYCNCNDNYPNNDNYYDWYVDGNDDYSDMHGQNPNNAFWDYDYSGYTGSNYDGFKDRYLTHPINDSKKILNGDPINRKVQSFYSNHCSDLRDAVRDEMNAIWNSSEYFGSFDRKATYTEYEFLRDYGHYLGVDPDGDGDTLCIRDDNSGACTTFNAKYNELERECFTYNQRIKIVTSNLSDLQKSDFINFHYETVDDYGYSCLDYTVSQWKDIYYLQNLHKINEFDDGDPPWKFTREDDTKEVDEDGEVIKNNRGACAQRCDDNNYGDDIGDCKNDLMYELQKNGCWYSNFWYYTPWDVTKGSEDVTGVRFAQSWVENDEEFICPSYYYNVLYPGLYLTEQQEDDLAWNDNIESFSIVNDSNYDTINNWSQTYNTDSDFSPTFDEVEAAFIGRIAGLYFNGKSNFLESTDIADYIRDSSYYNSESGANDSTSESYDENSDDNGFSIFLSFTPYCDQRLTVENADGVEELVEDDGDTSNDCTEIANETENRVVFSTNWENYNTNTNDAYNIGDTISISPDGSLYYSNSADSNYLIADAADFEKSDGNDVQGFYNETAYIYFSRDKDDGVTIQYSVDSGSITTADDDRVATFASGITHNNDYITKFSIGQEWDYLNQPSQFFLGYLHEFAVLNTSTATNENGITKINTDVKDAYAKTVTSLRNTYDSNDEDADYTESTCSNAFNSDMIQMGYGDSFTDGVFEIHHESIDDDGDFNLPDDISTGDYFYFRIKDYKVQCSNTVNAAYEEYSNNSGSASVTLIVSKDASSLLPQLKTFIVDPIIDIFECDEDECVFYKLFYENVIGTPGGEETLFQILLIIGLQFYIIFTAISFMFGLEKITNWELLKRILKIGLIYFLFSPDSFDNFREYVIVFVKDIPLEIGEFLASELTVAENLISTSQDEASIFDMLDNIIGLLLTTDIHGKILGMIFSTASGFLMAIIMYYAIFIFFKTVVLALIQYLVIIMLISLSLILAPFFIIFSLYGTTRPLFDSWLSFLIGNSFNLILFAVTVGFFSYITYAYMLNLFNYSVCWQPVIYCCSFMPYQFALFEFFAYTTFNYNRFGIDEVSGSGPEFIEVLGFFVIVFLFNKFLTISESIGSKIAEGGINTSGMAQGVMSSVASMPKQFTNTMDRTARSAVNTYMNDPKAYQRMKSNMKTKAYDKTFGKLDEKLTGNLSQTKKNQARAIKQAVKSAHAERQELKANKSNLQQEQKAIESKLKEKETKLAKLIKENPGSKKAEKLKSEIENLQARKDQIPSQIAELQSKEANFNLEDKIRENIADSGAMRSDKDIDQVMQSSKLAQDIEDVNKRMEKEDKWKQDKQEGRDKFDQMTGRSNTTPSDEDGSVLGENQAEVSEEEQERGSVVSPDGDPPAGTSEEEQERDLEVSPDGDPPAGTSEVDQRSSITEDSDDEEKEK